MGNIFKNRKSRQSREIGTFCQIQRLQEYRRGNTGKRGREKKNIRRLKYFFKIGAVMQRADQ